MADQSIQAGFDEPIETPHPRTYRLLLPCVLGLACAAGIPSGDGPDPVPKPSEVRSQTRFQACGDGTVADLRHGLLWEQKRGEPGGEVFCGWVPGGCPDPHGVDQRYTWAGSKADRNPEKSGAHGDFLATLNGHQDLPCFADHCDWRLPTVSEWKTILVGPDAGTGQEKVCVSVPCIDAGFPDGGRTSAGGYWSQTRSSHLRRARRFADFSNGRIPMVFQMTTLYVRAVRSGNCQR
ncbi:DUF1566 domain-containing protein [Myxococcota bacterium]|nr:DUF1566 domain-containing protein [Myxococcota bacterium]